MSNLNSSPTACHPTHLHHPNVREVVKGDETPGSSSPSRRRGQVTISNEQSLSVTVGVNANSTPKQPFIPRTESEIESTVDMRKNLKILRANSEDSFSSGEDLFLKGSPLGSLEDIYSKLSFEGSDLEGDEYQGSKPNSPHPIRFHIGSPPPTRPTSKPSPEFRPKQSPIMVQPMGQRHHQSPQIARSKFVSVIDLVGSIDMEKIHRDSYFNIYPASPEATSKLESLNPKLQEFVQKLERREMIFNASSGDKHKELKQLIEAQVTEGITQSEVANIIYDYLNTVSKTNFEYISSWLSIHYINPLSA